MAKEITSRATYHGEGWGWVQRVGWVWVGGAHFGELLGTASRATWVRVGVGVGHGHGHEYWHGVGVGVRLESYLGWVRVRVRLDADLLDVLGARERLRRRKHVYS